MSNELVIGLGLIIVGIAAILFLLFRKSAQEKERQLIDAIKALSLDALQQTSRSFLDLAKVSFEKLHTEAKGEFDKKEEALHQILFPVKEMLGKMGDGMAKLEKERRGDQESLKTHLQAMLQTERELRLETSNLVKALRTPIVRGRWGEIQLKRVVELAGMLNHCDFYEQQVGETLRPDLIVRLPGERQVVVDAKVPLEAYLSGIEQQNEGLRQEKMKDHARQVRGHMAQLSKKAYWEQFQPTPEFVVLFLPSETFFSAALEAEPSLIETGAQQGVILATPTTLIALLRAVAYGWNQERVSQHAEEVRQLGQELYKRLSDMNEHWSKLGRSLTGAVEAYNKAIGSLESRVMPSARRFKELGAASSHLELEPLEEVDRQTRDLNLLK